MAIPESQTVLKSFFETGDVPTQAQFAELIDTIFYLFNNAQATANTAVDTATAALAGANGRFIIVFNNNPFVELLGVNHAATTVLSTVSWRFTFTTPFLNANYVVVTANNCAVIAKNANYVDVQVSSTTNALRELVILGK